MSILENIANYEAAMASVRDHHMAAQIERMAGKVIVWYPEGYWPDGVRVDDSAKGLEQAISIMDRHWAESFPGYVA